jgi:hypothetical protein
VSVNAKGQGKGLWAERGDTFFTRSSSLLGRLIRWGETEKGETNGTWANHTGVVVESGWLVPPEMPVYEEPVKLAVIVEAMGHVQKGTWWGFHAKDYAKGMRIRVFSPVPSYTEEEKQRFVTFANVGIGQRYGWWKLFGFLAKRVTGINVPKIFFVKSRPVCSIYAALANEEARKRGTLIQKDPWPGFGMSPQAADPDEMLDFCEANRFWSER